MNYVQLIISIRSVFETKVILQGKTNLSNIHAVWRKEYEPARGKRISVNLLLVLCSGSDDGGRMGRLGSI